MKKKVILLTVIIGGVVIVMVSIFGYLKFSSHSTPSYEIGFKDISISNNILSIEGDLMSSAKAYKGYTYTIENGNLYITIKSGSVTKKYSDSHFDIIIKDDDLNKIDKVFIKHEKELTQIYPQK